MSPTSRLLAPAVALAALTTAGCGPAAPPTTQAPPPPRPPPEIRYNTGDNRGQTGAPGAPASPVRQANPGGGAPRADASQKARQMELLERIRKADPQFNTIDKAVMNEENDLALILDRRVQMADVPKLLKAMLGQMVREFPSEDLDVIAYAPSQPPTKIGTGHFDARTREISYAPARR